MTNRSYSTPANVFGIAAIVYYVVTKQRIETGQGMAYVGFPSNEPHVTIRPPVLDCGRSLLDNPAINSSGIYSKTLIRTLLQCLAYSPDEPLAAKQLLDACTKGRFVSSDVFGQHAYEISQPVTDDWPDRAAIAIGIPRYQDSKDLLQSYPTREAIAAAKEREKRFLESFWVTPPKQIAPSTLKLKFANPFNAGSELVSSLSTASSFIPQSSGSQSNNSNPFRSENNSGDNSRPRGIFMFG